MRVGPLCTAGAGEVGGGLSSSSERLGGLSSVTQLVSAELELSTMTFSD